MQHLCLVRPFGSINLPLGLVLAEVFHKVLALDPIDERLAEIVMTHQVTDLTIWRARSPMDLESALLRHVAVWGATVDILKPNLLLGLLDGNLHLVA